MKKLVITLVISILVLPFLGVIFANPAKAVASLYLSPGSGSFSLDQVISVNIRVNTGGEAVNAVQANFSYPANLLDAVGVSTGGSALTILAEKSAGGGIVKVGGGTPTPGFSGDKFIARVNFRVKASVGTANLAFLGDSAVLRNSDNANILAGPKGASFNLTPAPPAPPPQEAQTQPTPPSADVTSPKISNLTVVKIATNSATINWQTDEKSTSEVEYGLSRGLGLTFSNQDFITNHVIELPSTFLLPGFTYYYQIKSKDAAGNETKNEIFQFTTIGHLIELKITDQNGKPIKGAKVTLFSEPVTKITNQDGLVTFENVSAGKHAVLVELGKIKQLEQIEVSEDPASFNLPQAGKFQTFAFKTQKAPFPQILTILIIVLVLGVILAAGFFFRKHFRQKFTKSNL